MATAARIGYGTLLKMSDGGGPEVFTTIAEVKDISGPSLSMDPAEATSHDSANGWREFVAGLLDGGEVSFDINYIPNNATHGPTTGLLKVMKDRLKRNFQMVWIIGPTTWTLPCFVTGFEPGAPVDDILSGSVTLKVAGEPTLA